MRLLDSGCVMNENEKEVVSKMIEIFCRKKHGTKKSLCVKCQALEEYAHLRLDKCFYGEDKPFCEQCPVHCYKPDKRLQIQSIMRFSGPWMMVYEPRLAFLHLISRWKARNGSKKDKN